ncbi:MAG: hypothetical protein KatS3mg076_2160 [Candidatus Binatia bacterium]|nr:MAG: hypothetical protein KatS3mg076_2160 [Candidatus Binatia bacterium]
MPPGGTRSVASGVGRPGVGGTNAAARTRCAVGDHVLPGGTRSVASGDGGTCHARTRSRQSGPLRRPTTTAATERGPPIGGWRKRAPYVIPANTATGRDALRRVRGWGDVPRANTDPAERVPPTTTAATERGPPNWRVEKTRAVRDSREHGHPEGRAPSRPGMGGRATREHGPGRAGPSDDRRPRPRQSVALRFADSKRRVEMNPLPSRATRRDALRRVRGGASGGRGYERGRTHKVRRR